MPVPDILGFATSPSRCSVLSSAASRYSRCRHLACMYTASLTLAGGLLDTVVRQPLEEVSALPPISHQLTPLERLGADHRLACVSFSKSLTIQRSRIISPRCPCNSSSSVVEKWRRVADADPVQDGLAHRFGYDGRELAPVRPQTRSTDPLCMPSWCRDLLLAGTTITMMPIKERVSFLLVLKA